MKRTNFKRLILPIFLLLTLPGCNFQAAMEAGSTDSPSTEEAVQWETFPARVEIVEIQIQGPAPLSINLLVEGSLPDGCSEIGEIHQAYDSGRFIIEVAAHRPADQACTSTEPKPFSQTIALEGYALTAGTYKVDVNGTSDSFTLTEEQASQTSASPGTNSISGRIFHDECAILKNSSDEILETSEGCVENGEDVSANGTQEGEEKGISGILVSLGLGPCPSTGLAETSTSSGGSFSFEELTPGGYCVSIDPENSQNRPLLIPGSWTVSAASEGSISVSIGSGNTPQLLFGWDYQFLPVWDQAGCDNAFDFVDDVTIPDDTEFAPGDGFVKTWRIRNTGTCTWTPGYQLVFTNGSQMGAPDSVLIPSNVEAGTTMDISVDFTAPQSDGTYRSDWQMETPDGVLFGTGQNQNLPIWVQVRVGTVSTRPDYGSPDYTEQFNSGAAWYTGEDSNTSFSVQNGEMVMIGKQPGSWDGWTLTSAFLSDFYIEMTAQTGSSCSGLDRYGLLIRAPDNYSGYLVGFSCDGRYSLRRSDDSDFTAARDWTTSSHIKSGPNQTNRLGILASGSTLSIYANDVLLTEVTDDTYSEGRYGLFIASGSTNNFRVEVDSVSYWSSP